MSHTAFLNDRTNNGEPSMTEREVGASALPPRPSLQPSTRLKMLTATAMSMAILFSLALPLPNIHPHTRSIAATGTAVRAPAQKTGWSAPAPLLSCTETPQCNDAEPALAVNDAGYTLVWERTTDTNADGAIDRFDTAECWVLFAETSPADAPWESSASHIYQHQLTDEISDDRTPSIALDRTRGGAVVWVSYRTGNLELWTVWSDDVTRPERWSQPQQLTDDPAADRAPSICYDPQQDRYIVVWASERAVPTTTATATATDNETDGGRDARSTLWAMEAQRPPDPKSAKDLKWSKPVCLTPQISAREPTIVCDDEGRYSVVYIAGNTDAETDANNHGDEELQLVHSSQNGGQWSEPISIQPTSGDHGPLAASTLDRDREGNYWLAWGQYPTPTAEDSPGTVYLSRSNDGVVWENTTIATTLTASIAGLALVGDSSGFETTNRPTARYLVWGSGATGAQQLQYSRYQPEPANGTNDDDAGKEPALDRQEENEATIVQRYRFLIIAGAVASGVAVIVIVIATSIRRRR